MDEQPIVNITGEKVALGPLRRDLVPLYTRWVNDWRVTRTLDIGLFPRTVESEQDWFEGASRARSSIHFTLYERSTIRPIGTASLVDIDTAQRTADFGILIGETDCWGQGYATETAGLILEYGFRALGLHNIMLRVHSDNEPAIRAYRRAGFQPIGRRREVVRRGDDAIDLLYMDCLASEFRAGRPG